MDIDLSHLRLLEREKEISFEVLADAIEQALLTAYQRTPGAKDRARVVLDRKSGHVSVLAEEVSEDGTVLGEYDDTPDGFGRIAASTAKQVMLQRLREAEDEIKYGEFSGREGDVISGVIQQGRVVWNGPLTLSFGQGGTGRMTISLSNGVFNSGVGGLDEGATESALVRATLRYDQAPVSSPAAVPLPATLPLLAAGVGAIGLAARRRRDKAS